MLEKAWHEPAGALRGGVVETRPTTLRKGAQLVATTLALPVYQTNTCAPIPVRPNPTPTPTPTPSQGFETIISVPAATWIIPHTLGRRPDVAVYDSLDNLVIADVQSTTTYTTITFAVPTTGSAVLS